MANTETHFENARPRTAIKHGILKSYIDSWVPIMLQRKCIECPEIVIIDGFAGAGAYGNDHFGSPIIILKALYEHPVILKVKGKITFVCIEAMEENFKKLLLELEKIELPRANLTEIHVEPYHGDFHAIIVNEILPKYGNTAMLVFADPFGFNIHMDTFRAILRTHSWEHPKELFVNFMDSYVRRFERGEKVSKSLGKLFGNDEWRNELNEITDANEKLEILCNFFVKQLHAAYPLQRNSFASLKFGIRGNSHDHVYHLIFVTSHFKGLEKMKASMKKYSQSSAYLVFSEWVDNMEKKIENWCGRDMASEKCNNASDTMHEILKKFQGQIVSGENIRSFITSELPYHCNFVISLKPLLKEFSKNHERSFAKNIYQIPQNIDEELEKLQLQTPRKGEKHATIEDMINCVQNEFVNQQNVTGLQIKTFINTKNSLIMKSKIRAVRQELDNRGHLVNAARVFDNCTFSFVQIPSSSAVIRQLNFNI